MAIFLHMVNTLGLEFLGILNKMKSTSSVVTSEIILKVCCIHHDKQWQCIP